MDKLKFPITRNRFRYDLVKRHNNWCVVSQENLAYPECPVHYELWRIRIKKGGTYKGKDFPTREVMPPTESWGRDGFTYLRLDDCLTDFAKRANLPNMGHKLEL